MEKILGHAKSFKDLEVYKQSRELARIIIDLTNRFLKEERYSLTDQIRRSSRSVGAQIAESWGKRRYENLFVLKLTDSDAEQFETQHWIEVSF
jgi:four helix bundle protein